MIKKENKYSIYRVTDFSNQGFGKVYLGKTTSNPPKLRWYSHLSDARTKRKNTYFYNAIRAHGENNFIFEIIAECSTLENLNNLEIDIIAQYNSTDKNIGYNMTPGGDGREPGFIVTDNTREKMRIAQTGRKHSEITKAKMRTTQIELAEIRQLNNTQWHHTAESKAKISIALSGANHPLFGIPRTEEEKKKISDANKGKFSGTNNPFYGKKHTLETIAKMSVKSRTFDDKKLVAQLTNLYLNDNIPCKEIAKLFDLNVSTIYRELKKLNIFKK